MFKFYTMKIAFLSSELIYYDGRNSDDDKDCRVRVSLALSEKASNKNKWIMKQMGKK
jgi:hypothetical protein